MDGNELMWSEAATDVAAERNQRTYAVAKVAAQQTAWPFLAAAVSPEEYEARYELVADRVAAAVDQISEGDTALLDQVKTSLREDHGILLSARKQARLTELATAWADDSGPLFTLATRGERADQLADEIEALGAAVFTPVDRADLAELYRLAFGREPNFKVAAEIDPSDVPYEFDQAAYDAGDQDGYYGDNAGLEEHGNSRDYQRGMEHGRETAQDERMRPNEYHDAAKVKTAESHPPYYIRESGGQFKVVDAIGEERGSHSSRSEALAQQRALYANVPGAAEKAEQEHGHTPAAVQDVGRKGSHGKQADFERGPWMTWNNTSLYDVHGNKLGSVRPAEPHKLDGPWHAVMYRDRDQDQPDLPIVMGTHSSKQEAMDHIEELYGTQHIKARRTAEYHYIKQQGDKWIIWQKGTGKTLSTHDSKEKAERAFDAMETHMHSGAKDREYGWLDKEGVFHSAVNEDAFGAERYQHTPAPTAPSWIHDEFTTQAVPPPEGNPMENHADGDELKPTAPWLVAQESLRTAPVSTVNTLTANQLAAWRVPTTLTITADNPFAYTGPGSPQSPMSPPMMPGPADNDPNNLAENYLTPGAGSTDATNPSLNDLPAADGTNLMPMPSPEDDPTANGNATPVGFTGARNYAAAPDRLDRIAAQVYAANPGLTLREALALARRTVAERPEAAA